VLDGFPRTVPQADALERVLSERGQKMNAVLYLTSPEAELVARLSARRECPVCKRAYNLVTAPPKDGLHCDDHPDVELVQRADDHPDTVRHRLGVYQRQTAPLVTYYRERGTLKDVAGNGSMDEVYRALTHALNGAGSR
jgi:adenylate kinase